jgi:hypothetical protein
VNADGLRNLLIRLECDKIRVGSRGVVSSCPLARWKHPTGRDENPSFWVAIDEKGRSGWKCHSCTPDRHKKDEPHHDLVNLLNRLLVLNPALSHKYLALLDWVQREDQPSAEQLKAKLERSSYVPGPPREVAGVVVSESLAKKGDGVFVELPTLPEMLLANFQPLSEEARDYLAERGLTKESILRWEIGWHAGARRISLPIRDVKGNLVGISGRSVDPDQKPKFLHSNAFHRDFYLYGEQFCQTPQVAYLVEGFFDAIMLRQRGYVSPLCFMGGSISRFQVEKLVQLRVKEVVIIPDGDAPGAKIADGVLRAVSARIPTRVVPVPDGADPDDLTSDELLELLGPPNGG